MKSRFRHVRPVGPAVLTALAMLAIAFPAGAEAAPRQGVYESCAPAGQLAECTERLGLIRSAGFTVVLNYAQFYSTESELLAYADEAERLGIELIWPLKDRPWWGPGSLRSALPQLAATCRCTGDRGFIRYVVRLVRSHPATWGYYVSDEAPVSQARKIRRMSKQVKRLDSRHPRLAVAIGNPARVKDYLRPFARQADVLGADSYPVGTSQPLSTVKKVRRKVNRLARSRSDRSAMVIQSFSWAQYPGHASAIRSPNPSWPTRDQMARMRRMASPGTSLLLWYSFFDVMRSDDPARHLQDLRSAAFPAS